MIPLVAAACIAAGVFAGLWWGERCRRIDLAHQLGIRSRAAGWFLARKAKVKQSDSETPARREPIFSEEDRERMIRDGMAETGLDRTSIEADVDEMIAAASALGLG